MESNYLVEWLGYLASVLVACSMLMNSMIKLRVLNALGAFCFTIYGYAKAAYPVVLINMLVLVIHGYHLHKMYYLKKLSKNNG